MKIIITGSSGLVGQGLIASLRGEGHEVMPLVRGTGAVGSVSWDPYAGKIDQAALEGCDAVIHLSGDNLAQGRWTAAKKKRLVDSRVRTTAVLSEALARLTRRPEVFLCASAIGIYGDHQDQILTEDSPAGAGFIPDLCRRWEAAAAPAEAAGIRTVHMRLGVVLTPAGGALGKMLLPFKLGLGGILGSGRQYMSWITLDDVLEAVKYLLQGSQLAGPVNLVSPQPVTNREFTAAMGTVLHRPTILPAPAFALRLLLGEMADATLLSSIRVVPQRLEKDGFVFRHPQIQAALAHLLA